MTQRLLQSILGCDTQQGHMRRLLLRLTGMVAPKSRSEPVSLPTEHLAAIESRSEPVSLLTEHLAAIGELALKAKPPITVTVTPEGLHIQVQERVNDGHVRIRTTNNRIVRWHEFDQAGDEAPRLIATLIGDMIEEMRSKRSGPAQAGQSQ